MPRTIKLLVIRHGESEADLLHVHEGRADFALTEKGRRQAESMSRWAAQNYSVDRIYCSSLKRAYQTAEFLSGKTGRELSVEPDLMEFNNGLLAGLDFQQAQEKYPRVSNVPLHQSVYEQESMLYFRYRADCIWSKILSENSPENTIAIVSHGGMINQLFRTFLRLPVDSDVFLRTGDTGVHLWEVTETARRILFSNSGLHLSALTEPVE